MARSGKYGQIKTGIPANSTLVVSMPVVANVIQAGTDKMVSGLEPILLYDFNGLIDDSNYEVNLLKNEITWLNGFIPTGEVDADAYVYDVVVVGGFFEWTLDREVDTEEVTAFEDEGNKRYVATLKGATVSATSYFQVENLDKISEEYAMFLLLHKDKNVNWGKTCFAILTGRSKGVPVDGIIEESIEFVVDGKVEDI